jgi:Calpain family cysteine protease
MVESIQGAGRWPPEVDFENGDPAAGPPEDATSRARAVRAAADARYQAFIASGPPADPCFDFGASGHDYDRCVRDPVPNAVLFQREGADADALDPRDVQQGGLGDCHFMAPLAALASTPEGRAALRSAVVENRNDLGDVVSWTVTLHAPESHWLGKTTFRDVSITVSGPFAVGHARVRTGSSEVWPLVFEKAYAQYAGGYNRIGRGGVPTASMALLTGREATYFSLNWPSRCLRSYGANELRTDLASGKMVVLSSRAEIGGSPGPDATPAQRQAQRDAHGLIGGHGYFAMGIEEHDGKSFVRLGNPWGDSQPDLIPSDELSTWFSGVTVGTLR